ncbi:hypothetical protein AVEN_110030-1 [Araneus ventricosus]|uniref:RNase H type-1 domain-containing protein n=1 Tax=Araneus ventricosus TaxID=182803 RepID=A0A4Y2H121_ARAVE|nr:hypothetical protein AVEN_110030-1 [Araneus ventricosus]
MEFLENGKGKTYRQRRKPVKFGANDSKWWNSKEHKAGHSSVVHPIPFAPTLVFPPPIQVEKNVNIQGNEIADALAKTCADDASVPSAPLTYLELFSRAKSRNKTIWLIPPVHHWYRGSRSCGCLSIDCSRRDQTTLKRFLSGHIRSLTFSDNSKCFEICPKCTAEQATPDHILACQGLSQQDLVSNPLLTLDFFKVHRLMDLI